MDPKDEFGEGIDLFNREYFFECHDVLEELWMRERGDHRDFYKGLIQIAGGFHHHQNDNPRGAVALLRKGSGYLRKYGSRFLGVDLEDLLAKVDVAIVQIERLRNGRSDREDVAFPKIRYEGGWTPSE
jgi:predicted metal-dependent hydrolase